MAIGTTQSTEDLWTKLCISGNGFELPVSDTVLFHLLALYQL